MEGSFNVNKLKMEHKNVYDLVVHASKGLNVGVLKHIFDVVSVDFNDQVPNT